MDRSKYEIVVGPADLAVADALFAEWCRARGWTRESLGDDLVVDTGRGIEGDWRRYLVRSAVLRDGR